MNSTNRILIKAPNWLGDNVFTLPAARKLRSDYPRASVSVLVKASLAPLWEMVPEVESIIPYEIPGGFKGRGPTAALIRKMRAAKFDLAVIFPRSFSSALWCFLAGIPERRGHAAEGRSILLTRRCRAGDYRSSHRVDYYYRLVGDPERDRPCPVLTVPDKEAEEALALVQRITGIKNPDSLVGLHPGGHYGPAKRWPTDRFGRLARSLTRSGRVVLVFGGAEDKESAQQIVSASSTGAWNLAGDTGIKRLTALLKLCRVVVANDSGPLHLAAAVGVTAIGIFGSTDPAATGPRGGMTRVIHHPVPCSPCLQRTCRGDFECMNSITPERVMAVIETA